MVTTTTTAMAHALPHATPIDQRREHRDSRHGSVCTPVRLSRSPCKCTHPRLIIAAAASGSSAAAVESSESSDSAKMLKRRLRPGEKKGFVEEMRFVAMKLHTRDQAKEGEKEADVQPVGSWNPSISGYLQFLVDSKLVFDTLESIVENASNPCYAEFQNTGLERSAALTKDLEWFKRQGHEIPEPGSNGKAYADYLVELSENDPPAFICHFYNVYFAHTAGGRFIGKKVAESILDGKQLEFYKYERELPETLASVKEKLNRVAEDWSREDKDRCLKETQKSFEYSGKILRLIIS